MRLGDRPSDQAGNGGYSMTEHMRNYDFSEISVLVTEHNSYMRRTIHSILRTFNIGQIIEAKTIEQGWDLFVSYNPDVVFVDWAPGFDGMTMLKQIRRETDSPNPFVPVVVVTSLTEQKHVLTARDLGMTEFLAKPFSPRLIFQRMQTIADRPRAFIRAGDFFGPDRRRRTIAVNEDRRANGVMPTGTESSAPKKSTGI